MPEDPKLTEGVASLDVTETEFIATLSNKKKIRLSMALDLEELMDLVEGVQGIDDEDDPFEVLRKLRAIIPAQFMQSTKGVDAALSLRLFTLWAQALGTRLGKALT